MTLIFSQFCRLPLSRQVLNEAYAPQSSQEALHYREREQWLEKILAKKQLVLSLRRLHLLASRDPEVGKSTGPYLGIMTPDYKCTVRSAPALSWFFQRTKILVRVNN